MNPQSVPDITVAVMSYNNAAYLRQTLDSIFAQRGVSFEVLVFDDCSKDDSLDILRSYEGREHYHFEVNPQNLGVVGNATRCFESGRGRYVVVLGSDDFLYPGHLQSLFQALEDHPQAALAYSQCNWIDEHGNLVRYAEHPAHATRSYVGGRDEVVDLLRHDNYITPSAVMLRRSVYERIRLENGRLLHEGMIAGDWEFWIRIARVAPDFVFVRRPTVGYRVHSGQISQTFYSGDGPTLEHAFLLEYCLAQPDLLPRLRAAAEPIWNLFQQRLNGASSEVREQVRERSAAIRRQLFDTPAAAAGAEPLFSVILTTFNRPELLRDALASLAAQTFQDFEVVLVNDCGEPVEQLLQGYEFPISYLRLGRNSGLSAARNAAIRQARGRYLAYLDDDDTLLPQHFQRHAAAHADAECLVYTDTRYVLESLEGGRRQELSRQSSPVHGEFDLARLQVQNFIPVNAWTHPRSWIDEVGGFDEGLSALEDWDMLLRLSVGRRFSHVAEETVQVHVRQENPEQRMSARERKNFPALFRRLYERHAIETDGSVQQARAEFLAELDRERAGAGAGPVTPVEFRYCHRLSAQQLSAFQRRLGDHPGPRFEVVVLGGAEAAAQSSLASVAAQQLAAPSTWLPGEAGETPQQFWERVARHLAGSDAEWFYLLPAGDRLAEHALLLLADRILSGLPARCYYVDEDRLEGDQSHTPIFKPDFNLDLLRSYPYTGRNLCVARECLDELGGLRAEFAGLCVQDLQLRAAETFGLDSVGHVAEVLCHAAVPFAEWLVSDEVRQHGAALIAAHLARLGVPHTLQAGVTPGVNRIRYDYPQQPLVSILIPTKDQLAILRRCVESILEKTRYEHFEILIIDNDSQTEEARQWLAGIESMGSAQVRVLRYPGPFNFSAINNAAAREAKGEYLVLLNNDTAVVDADWLDELLNHGRRPEVGIVGAKLHYPDGRIQHGGVILGLNGPADHPFIGDPQHAAGYMQRLLVDQDYSAVTAACLLIRREVYEAVGGMDEVDFKVSYNDVDLCLKVREAGYLTLWTPYAALLHEGSVSQRELAADQREAKLRRFRGEQQAMYRKWLPLLAQDPAYNPNLSLQRAGFELDVARGVAWQPFVQPLMPRVVAYPADATGCGHYRVRQPFLAMQRQGLLEGALSSNLLDPVELQRFDADSVVLQRQVTDAQLDAIEQMKAFNRSFRVYELDDYLPNLPLKSLHRDEMPRDILRSLRRAVSMCDRFVVSTDALAESLADLHSDIRVLPNRLPVDWWEGRTSRRRVGRKPRVGWAGGVGHTGDLELIADVVRDLADEVDWVFFGLCPDKLRPYVSEYYPGVAIADYPERLASLDLDLALAPLEQNRFNDCKSNLRLLEYGVLGFPVVCSDVLCYRGDLPVTRVKNRYRDWVDAIRMHLSDLDATARIGDELQARVRRDWMLEGENLLNWGRAWLPD